MAQATLSPDTMTLAASGMAVANPLVGEAVELAQELTQIEMIYGEDCVAAVQRALRSSPSPWRVVVENTVLQWAHDHPRFHLNEF